MKQLLTAVMLAAVFSISVSAGEIPTSGFTSAPPSQAAVLPGEIPSVPGDNPNMSAALQSQGLLDLIQLMLGLTI